MTGSPPPELRPFQGPEHLPFQLGEGPGAILMIHGFGGTPAEHRGLGEILASQGWHTEALLLPGFGPDIVNLDKTHPRDWFNAVQVAWESLRASYDPCILFGFSMGAAVALNVVASLQPDRMILAAPFWRLPGWMNRVFPAMQWLNLKIYPFKRANFNDPRLRQFIERLLPGINLDNPAEQEYIRKELSLPIRTIYEILKMGQHAYRLSPTVATPTLVIQGLQDMVVQPASTRRLVSRLPVPLTTYREIPGMHDLLPRSMQASGSSERDPVTAVPPLPLLETIFEWLPVPHNPYRVDRLLPLPAPQDGTA